MLSAKNRGYDIDLYRSNRSSVFAGVCGGIAENLNWSPIVVRLAWVGMFMFSGAFALFGYVAAIFLIANRQDAVKLESPSSSQQSQYAAGDRHQPNLKDKVFQQGEAASARVEQMRERMSRLDKRIRAMEEHVTSKKFQFDRELRRS